MLIEQPESFLFPRLVRPRSILCYLLAKENGVTWWLLFLFLFFFLIVCVWGGRGVRMSPSCGYSCCVLAEIGVHRNGLVWHFITDALLRGSFDVPDFAVILDSGHWLLDSLTYALSVCLYLLFHS